MLLIAILTAARAEEPTETSPSPAPEPAPIAAPAPPPEPERDVEPPRGLHADCLSYEPYVRNRWKRAPKGRRLVVTQDRLEELQLEVRVEARCLANPGDQVELRVDAGRVTGRAYLVPKDKDAFQGGSLAARTLAPDAGDLGSWSSPLDVTVEAGGQAHHGALQVPMRVHADRPMTRCSVGTVGYQTCTRFSIAEPTYRVFADLGPDAEGRFDAFQGGRLAGTGATIRAVAVDLFFRGMSDDFFLGVTGGLGSTLTTNGEEAGGLQPFLSAEALGFVELVNAVRAEVGVLGATSVDEVAGGRFDAAAFVGVGIRTDLAGRIAEGAQKD